MNRASLAVTTELRGDRYLGRMRIVSVLAKMFDVPMDVVEDTHRHANVADEAAEQVEWIVNTVAVAATDFVMHGETFYAVKDGKATHLSRDVARDAMYPKCAVCRAPVRMGQWCAYHQRLKVWVHAYCPLTNVCGEDISTHTLTTGIMGL